MLFKVLTAVADMKIQLVWVGKIKSRPLRALTEEYIARIRKFIECAVVEMREQTYSKDMEVAVIQRKETRQVLDHLQAQAGFKIALSPHGKLLSSQEFAELLRRHRNGGTRLMHFILGSFLGLSPEIEKASDLQMSLSRMTMTHEMARLVLTEQIYRAFTIIHGLPYQK